MKKIALFAFNGDAMCFVHVLLNALEFDKQGYEVKVVIEGSATALISELNKPDAPFHNLYKQMLEKELVDGICKACSAKTGSLKEAENQNLTLLDEMSGHPSMASYISNGFEVITF